jgi:hypothetical protein
MSDEKRAAPRMTVSILMSCPDSAPSGLRLHDMSAGGFLASGSSDLKVGDSFTGSVHLYPSSGEREVCLHGTVMRSVQDGERRVIGVRIDGFDSSEGETTYRDFVRELEEDN